MMKNWLQMGVFLGLALLLIALATVVPSEEVDSKQPSPFLEVRHSWADSTLRSLSIRAQLEQMLIVEERPDSGAAAIHALMTYAQPGGILFAEPEWVELRSRVDAYQRRSRLPLLMAIHTRGQSAWLPLPSSTAINAIKQDSVFFRSGQWLGVAAQQQGIHLLLTPGPDQRVSPALQLDQSSKLRLLNQGMQAQHVLATPTAARPYFPQERDSLRLKALLAPYKQLAASGTAAMLLEKSLIDRIHLNSQREQIIRRYLQQQIGFDGLLLARLQEEPGEEEEQLRKMLKAGVDVILLRPEQYQLALSLLENLHTRGFLPETEITAQAKRMLLAKTWAKAPESHRLLQRDSFRTSPIKPDSRLLERQLAQASLTLVRNEKRVLPFQSLSFQEFHLHSVGQPLPVLLRQMQAYAGVSASHQPLDGDTLPALPIQELRRYKPVLLSLAACQPDSGRDRSFFASLRQLQRQTQVVLLHTDHPADLSQFPNLPSMFQAYGTDSLSQSLLAQALFGGLTPQGQYPLDMGTRLVFGQGEHPVPNRIAYSLPEELGMSSLALAGIDSIVAEGIREFAMPGAQVLVAKAGKVVYHKSFGHHTYAAQQPVELTDLYDLASVTKVAATTLAAMRMDQQGKLQPSDRLGKFFRNQLVQVPAQNYTDTLYVRRDSLPIIPSDSSPFVRVSERNDAEGFSADTLPIGVDSLMIVRKWERAAFRRSAYIFDLTIGELLSHHSGMPAGLPILPYLNYKDSLTGRYDRFFHPQLEEKYSIEVAGRFYLRQDYLDSLWEATKGIVPSAAKAYEYSDANLILVQQAIDSFNREPINEYVQRELYQPLGMQRTSFLPRQTFPPEEIVPTEYDGFWRGQLLRGYVHDPTAALLGGVSGNAGLFSNANGLAHLFQMLLNLGHYGGERFLDDGIVREFTRSQYGHRGYGFDKPPHRGSDYIISAEASPNSFGHTGFTGTCVWADPEEELIFVFLSNRVHPRSSNWTLNELRIRQRIHDVIYASLP